jgi:hypothetical protein
VSGKKGRNIGVISALQPSNKKTGRDNAAENHHKENNFEAIATHHFSLLQ